MAQSSSSGNDHSVVIIGGGFAGLHAARRLARAGVQVTLIDRRNFHLFQPLSYQVATAALSASDITYPLRELFKRDSNVRVVLGEVAGFDLRQRRISLAAGPDFDAPTELGYDTLVVAAGSSYSFFGHEEWREHAFEVKSLESAERLRSDILAAFERAELADDPAQREAELTFVVVGGGPTGVEMAGQIAELARDTLPRNFRSIDPRTARVLLLEMTERLLLTFPKSLSAKAQQSLERIGVTTVLGERVVAVEAGSVTLQSGDSQRTIAARTIIWAAGVTASPLARMLGEATGAEIDRAGRLTVEPDLTLPGHPEVFALGDMVQVRDPTGSAKPLPGVAPVAIQQGKYAAKVVLERLDGRRAKPFRYFDKGNVATIGRASAVVDLGWLRLSGPVAWLVWLVVHIYYLIGFQNRLLVLVQWGFSFLANRRSSRIISEPAPPSGREAGMQ